MPPCTEESTRPVDERRLTSGHPRHLPAGPSNLLFKYLPTTDKARSLSTLCRRRSSIEGRTRPRSPRFGSPIPPKTHGSATISSSCRLSHDGECAYILRCGDTLMYVHLSVNSVSSRIWRKSWISRGSDAPGLRRAPALLREVGSGRGLLELLDERLALCAADRSHSVWRP